jgi:predicted short-subunit dehydrogenase-like oxidoreductase (DUF2520 family)
VDGGGDVVTDGRLAVGVVGAGRVGAAWAAALAGSGHTVVGASGISEESQNRIEALLPGVPRLDPEAVVRSADLVLVTVPDDEIEGLVSGLASRGAWRAGQIAVHASGRHGLKVLAAATGAGVAGLAIHPAMAFTGTSLDLVRMRGAVFAVTALAQHLAIVIAEDDRPLYHAALAHGANHLVAILLQASEALRQAGVEEPGRVLRPLVEASIEGALAGGGIDSLTGPIVRGDAGTLAAHLEALRPFPKVLESYRALAAATADLALEGGRISATQYAGVMDALGVSP